MVETKEKTMGKTKLTNNAVKKKTKQRHEIPLFVTVVVVVNHGCYR